MAPEVTFEIGNAPKLFWYANSNSSEPIGPTTAAEVQKHIALGLINLFSVVWCEGMPKWEKATDHFDIPSSVFSDRFNPSPPPLPNNFKSSSMPEVLNILNMVGTWNPPPYVYRFLARFTLACGLLTIILSLILVGPFGMSSFSAGQTQTLGNWGRLGSLGLCTP